MTPPLLRRKDHDAPSVFTPENLLREARRQNEVEPGTVPAVCLLDPDGDIVDRLRADGATPHPHWPGYHTTLYETELAGRPVGVLGRAVGASFAVLVAEQLFAAGCELLISITSAGQIVPRGETPYFVLIEDALRDEGTSYHYRPPSAGYTALASPLRTRLRDAFSSVPIPVHAGSSWTTDAPYRETESAIAAAREEGVLAVEMEAAALYAFAEARGQPVVCFAHVTNRMAVEEGDFEKGEADGVRDALTLTTAAINACEDLLSENHPEPNDG